MGLSIFSSYKWSADNILCGCTDIRTSSNTFCVGPWTYFGPRAYKPAMLHCNCYYQLRQLKVVSRSLTFGAASTLVHSFIISWLDHCSTLYHGLLADRIGCLKRVLCCATWLVGHIQKCLCLMLWDVLHWLPSPQRIEYRVCALVRWCSTVSLRTLFYHLGCQCRSMNQAELLLPCSQTDIRQRCSFYVTGPTS